MLHNASTKQLRKQELVIKLHHLLEQEADELKRLLGARAGAAGGLPFGVDENATKATLARLKTDLASRRLHEAGVSTSEVCTCVQSEPRTIFAHRCCHPQSRIVCLSCTACVIPPHLPLPWQMIIFQDCAFKRTVFPRRTRDEVALWMIVVSDHSLLLSKSLR